MLDILSWMSRMVKQRGIPILTVKNYSLHLMELVLMRVTHFHASQQRTPVRNASTQNTRDPNSVIVILLTRFFTYMSVTD
jgi:hypothetical protein